MLLTNTAQELNFQNLSSFTTDDGAAAEQVIELLAGQGHRHIGLIGVLVQIIDGSILVCVPQEGLQPLHQVGKKQAGWTWAL